MKRLKGLTVFSQRIPHGSVGIKHDLYVPFMFMYSCFPRTEVFGKQLDLDFK
jgi:hypothetical protein